MSGKVLAELITRLDSLTLTELRSLVKEIENRMVDKTDDGIMQVQYGYMRQQLTAKFGLKHTSQLPPWFSLKPAQKRDFKSSWEPGTSFLAELGIEPPEDIKLIRDLALADPALERSCCPSELFDSIRRTETQFASAFPGYLSGGATEILRRAIRERSSLN